MALHQAHRRDDLWPAHRVEALEAEVRALAPWTVVSGGWAWHFLAPPGHVEHKRGHDHKDIDLFVRPDLVGALAGELKARGYQRVWTRFDRRDTGPDFKRYERHVVSPQGPVKAQIDLFVQEVPTRRLGTVHVVAPHYLLGLYRNIQPGTHAWAVVQAHRLMQQGIDPYRRDELTQSPRLS